MSDVRIALAVIAGDDCFEQGIENMLGCVEDLIDGIYISFNGSDVLVKDKLRGLAMETCDVGNLAQIPWEDDFALARNHSFYLVHEAPSDYDWILWLDCDDVLSSNFDVRAAIKDAEFHHRHMIFMQYDYQSDDHGLRVSHLKERVFRADVAWRWIYPVHENCTGPVGTRHMIADRGEYGSVIHRRGSGNKRDRNRRIIARWHKAEPDDLRAVQMMAHEVYVVMEEEGGEDKKDIAREALGLYRKFIDSMPPNDDAYIANLQVGRLHYVLGEYQNAINIFLQGIKMRPMWPGAYCEIAESYLRAGYYKLAIEWATVTRTACELPDETFVPVEPLDLVYRPLMIQASAHVELGEYDRAGDCYTKALAIRDDDFTMEALIAARMREQSEVNRSSHPDEVREALWGLYPDRSIAFVTRPHFETWDVRRLEEDGLGGTETSVIRLAQEFVKADWRVVIFGTPEHEGVADGIEWWETRRWHPDEPFSATVAVRMPELYDADVKSRVKALWLHDVNMGDIRLGDEGHDRFARPDVIVCPSTWHANHIKKVYNLGFYDEDVAPVEVIPNGLDVDKFRMSENPSKVLTRFVYASSPDRGLDRLLDFWPIIREMHPAAELDIFYGWDNIDKMIEWGVSNAGQLAYFKAKIIAKIERLGGWDAGIRWMGRVSEDVLARHLKNSGFMLYPADFMETFGIVFQQALVAGCIPVACNLGALRYLIPLLCQVDGAPNSEIFEASFLGRLEALMSMSWPERQSLVALHTMRAEELVWPRVARQWASLFEYVDTTLKNPVEVIKP